MRPTEKVSRKRATGGKNESRALVAVVFTHSDCILADEARETPSAVPDRELCAILNICARLLRVVAMVQP